VQAEARLGLPVEDAFEKMAQRMNSNDFAWAVSAINIQREVGGNLAEVLDIVAETIRDRDSLRREVDSLTSEGRLSATILTILPFAIGTVMFLLAPDYIGVLFSSASGWGIAGFAALLLLIGILWLRQVTKIEV
jgi:tight adherence protein B